MANDVVRFVDAISASPTTRLDLNDGTTFTLNAAVLADPPKIHGAISSNAMTDGGYQSSSQYDYRVIHLELILNVATQDAAATALQNLHRELDRETNYLKWQPDGASKPVFFKTWRTSPLQIIDQPAARAVYFVTLEIPADPFGSGVRATISPGTVSNDPAAANGCYIDVTGVIGDVAADPVITFGTDVASGDTLLLASLASPGASLPVVIQAESMTAGTDTTNPGGGPDAAMSGTGTNNFMRSTMATAAMSSRLSWNATTQAQRTALNGSWRVFAVARRVISTSTVSAKIAWSGDPGLYTFGSTVTLAGASGRQVIDFGVITFGSGSDIVGGAYLGILAERTAGAAENIEWDYLLLFPASQTLMIAGGPNATGATINTIDAIADLAYATKPTAADRFTGNGYTGPNVSVVGGFPTLYPNVTNRLYFQVFTDSTAGSPVVDKTKTTTVTVNYYPQYLHARPATT